MVAPTSVKRGSSSRIERADGPLPMTMSSWKSSIAGIEHLLDRARETMDLVDEEHVAVVEVGEDRREVAGAFERGTARDAQADVELGGDDARQRGLAEPGRAGEQDVVDRLPAAARGAEHDLEVLLQPRLADELVESARPERRLLGHLHRIGRRHQQLFPRHGAAPIRFAPRTGA